MERRTRAAKFDYNPSSPVNVLASDSERDYNDRFSLGVGGTLNRRFAGNKKKIDILRL